MKRSAPNMKAALRASVRAQDTAEKDRFTVAERTLAALHPSSESDASAKPAALPVSRVVRDTFTMPPDEHAWLAELQQRALKLGLVASKSQLVRAGLRLLRDAGDRALTKAIKATAAVPTGRRANS